ncbi:DUF4350 domain-containing protein [Verrucomicrobiota bacterium sgz303538]
MLKRQLLTATVAVLLVFALGYGLLRLFALRVERGDVYPAYSTLRADPLGARAFYEALERLPGFEVSRNFRPLQKLRPNSPVTLVYAGVARNSEWGNEELKHFETLVGSGSRAVFVFAPADLQPPSKSKDGPKGKEEVKSTEVKKEAPAGEQPKDTTPPKEETGKGSDTEEHKEESDKREAKLPGPKTVPFREVAERWGFRFDVAQGKRAGSFHGEAKLESSESDLEPQISWHSALRFGELQPAWRVLYRVAGEPAIIERRWGDGTIVLAADSFFLSNEALQKERHSRLLAWLVGDTRTIVFDEEHLGVAESSGVATLARKYRLQGAMVALALVALLWIWRQSVRFVPVVASPRGTGEFVAGLDSHAGFVSLLRRSLPPSQVLSVCVDEWRKTFSHDKRAVAIVEQTLEETQGGSDRKRDVVGGYHSITRALQQKS